MVEPVEGLCMCRICIIRTTKTVFSQKSRRTFPPISIKSFSVPTSYPCMLLLFGEDSQEEGNGLHNISILGKEHWCTKNGIMQNINTQQHEQPGNTTNPPPLPKSHATAIRIRIKIPIPNIMSEI